MNLFLNGEKMINDLSLGAFDLFGIIWGKGGVPYLFYSSSIYHLAAIKKNYQILHFYLTKLQNWFPKLLGNHQVT